MDSKNDRVSDAEDLPSDFFDDFSKDEFLNGLSVVDSWDEENSSKPRIDTATLDRVKDLRELISDGKSDDNKRKGSNKNFNNLEQMERSSSNVTESRRHLEDYIKPGSRRDPSKTNEAIRKDKQVKVKEYLAKHLDSSEDLKPPGTELDDYYAENIKVSRKRSPVSFEDNRAYRPRDNHYSHYPSPNRRYHVRESPDLNDYIHHGPFYKPKHFSPGRKMRRPSPYRIPHRYSPRRSPHYVKRSRSPNRRSITQRSFHRPDPVHRVQVSRSPKRRSPVSRSPMQMSPVSRLSMQRSPVSRLSMQRSPVPRSPVPRSPIRRSPIPRSPIRRSPIPRSPIRRSPVSRSSYRRSYSSYTKSPSPQVRDTFLYPENSSPSEPYPSAPTEVFPGYQPELPYSNNVESYSYPQNASYAPYTRTGYEYGVQPDVPPIMLPQPVPAPGQGLQMPYYTPEIVPPTLNVVEMSPAIPVKPSSDTMKLYDPLAQLVADGKLSQEDYLKLAPNKGINSPMDSKTRVTVLSRCNEALSKLANLLLPTRILVNSDIIGQEPKCLAPKFCSPLKRQASIELQYTKSSDSSAQHNKQLVESIIATIELDKVISKTKKLPKNMKNASVQTTRLFCDVCEIRESMNSYDASTFTNPEYFSSSIHTQVVEEDLMSSKSIFNPTGSATSSAPISIAHMTPAQLVSQLAAKAKTLKESPDLAERPNHFSRRNPPNKYGPRSQYHGNYRY